MSLLWAVLTSETTLQAQCLEAVILSPLVFVALRLVQAYVHKVVANKPYIPNVISLQQRSAKKMANVDLDDEAALVFWEKFWGVGLQHGVGGVLCIPAVFALPICSNETACMLARHGALVEVAWEIGDVCQRAYELLFGGQVGKDRNPPSILALLAIHHSMSIALVIPMNITYPHLLPYFELVFILQFVAALAILIGQYSMTLAVDKPFELAQMFYLSCLNFCAMIISRLVYYWWPVLSILATFWADGRTAFFGVGFVVGVLLMPLIGLLFAVDGNAKVQKFRSLYFGGGAEGEEEDGEQVGEPSETPDYRRKARMSQLAHDINSNAFSLMTSTAGFDQGLLAMMAPSRMRGRSSVDLGVLSRSLLPQEEDYKNRRRTVY